MEFQKRMSKIGLVVESEDEIGGPVHISRGIYPCFQGAHSLRSGLAWFGQLAGPARVRGAVRAFPQRTIRFRAPLRTVATWGRTLCLFESPCSRQNLRSV